MRAGPRRHRLGVLSVVVLTAAGCMTGYSEVEPRGGWRAAAEDACMAALPASAGIEPGMPVGDALCGIEYPLKVAALSGGHAKVSPEAVLGCPMTAALDAWYRESVQPAAVAWIGSAVVEMRQLSSYACRKRNNVGGEYSEHAFGNALDIAGFTFADGRTVTMARDWRGAPEVQGFFREIFATACERFTTVLGPGSNFMHYNHIHIDLAAIAPDRTAKMCKPAPSVAPPMRAPFDPGVAFVAGNIPAAADDGAGAAAPAP